MSSEGKTNLHLEIAHVLFMDVVGYSKLLVDDQAETLQLLNQVVRGTGEFRAAEEKGELIRLPTGDGMALVFLSNPEDPVQCAIEISKAIKSYPELQLRMGIHSGPVNKVSDVNDRANVTGAGINMAQRVMDCGDAGHILLSKRAADDLAQYRHWQPCLHDVGELEVKHGALVHVFNLYTDEAGNPQTPQRLTREVENKKPIPVAAMPSARPAIAKWAAIAALILLLAGAAFWLLQHKSAFSVTSSPIPSPPPMASSAPAIPEKSIAVLPFENLSEEKANAFFADGVQDAILTELARIADLKVISRTSVMQYRSGAVRNLREIGQQLGVAHLLEGSIQRAGGIIRVNAQLIDTRSDAHLWAENYDRPLDDVFAIQSEIAKTIADQLRAKLSPQEKAAIEKPPTTNLVANDLYVQAKKLDDLSNDPSAKESLLEATRLLDEAIIRDPGFLLAYCLLCKVHLDIYWNGFDHTSERRDRANVALENAARLQPAAGEVHLARANYFYHGFRDYDHARAELDLARSSLPNDAAVYFTTAAIDRRQARWNESLRNFNRAAELDPRNLLVLEETGFTNFALRRYAETKQLLERALAVSPHDYFVRTELAALPFEEHGDLALWRKQLTAIENESHDAATHIALALITCALAERNLAAATRAVSLIPPEGLTNPATNFMMPRDYFVGLVARTFRNVAAEQTAFASARAIAVKTTRDQPVYAAAWSLLGIIDAGLDHKADAIQEGRRACELLPVSSDSWEGPQWMTNLAIIYGWVGDKGAALKQLSISAQIPAGVNYGELKLFPEWDPLRGDPRFEEIVASLAPKEVK